MLFYACVEQGAALYLNSLEEKFGPKQKMSSANIMRLVEYRQLSDAQKEASLSVIQYFHKQQFLIKQEQIRPSWLPIKKLYKFLIWAVTGAGKTEMIFPIIDYFAAIQSRILIATPRRDVVLELTPRLRKAFPHLRIVSLYGGSSDIWEAGSLFIATTHQVMRFHRCFDLIIVDEMDAFPYHGDKTLHRVLERAHKIGSYQVLLTATPPKRERMLIKLHMLPHVKVPVRYHKHPLPVPIHKKSMTVQEMLLKRRASFTLLETIKRSYSRGAVLFLFVQRIAELEPLACLLRKHLPQLRIAQTSSIDTERADKVSRFRNREIDVLLTTSILERGVTVVKSDVCIVDADQPLFDRTAIIQMTGRAGRSSSDPSGLVTLLSKQISSEINAAIKQIKQMNRLAQKKGYFRGDEN